MKKENKPLARKENIVIQEADGEVLIYDLEKNKAFCLNQTSALVWQSCDGQRTIAEIGDVTGKQLNAKISDDVVWLALDQISKENLLQNETALESKFNGMSRREIIRKIGLVSAVALPAIASVVVPTSVHAQGTCAPNDNPCTISAQCCSMCCKEVGGGINQCKPGGGNCLP